MALSCLPFVSGEISWVVISNLGEMLEGQVAVLSSRVFECSESIYQILDAPDSKHRPDP
jgi:hypothetical protein